MREDINDDEKSAWGWLPTNTVLLTQTYRILEAHQCSQALVLHQNGEIYVMNQYHGTESPNSMFVIAIRAMLSVES